MEICAKCNEPESNLNNKTGINSYFGDSFDLWFCNDCAIDRDNFIRESRDEVVSKFIQPERSKREDLKCDNCKIPRVFNCCWANNNIDYRHKNNESCDEYNFKMRCSEHCGNTVRGK